MKTLKHCIKLGSQIRVYVPSTVNTNQAFNSIEWIDKTLALLSAEFGGATATTALGAWIGNQGDLIKEKVTIVFSYARQEQLEHSINKIYDFCVSMKIELAQETIALEVNGEMYLI